MGYNYVLGPQKLEFMSCQCSIMSGISDCHLSPVPHYPTLHSSHTFGFQQSNQQAEVVDDDLLLRTFKRHLKEHGSWKSFSRGIYGSSTHNNLGIRVWQVPSRLGRLTLKNTSSYLLINNSVSLHMSENTQYRGTVHNTLCGCTCLRQNVPALHWAGTTTKKESYLLFYAQDTENV